MDIVSFWDQQVSIWNDENKCDLCWSFGAPLTESALNMEQLTDEQKCCTNVFITALSFSKTIDVNPATSWVRSETCNYSFTLYVLKASTMDRNNYNEIKGYDKDSSKWSLIYEPIISCVSCDNALDFCELLGYNVDIVKWEATLVSNYMDSGYDGWKINATFRVKDQTIETK